MGTNDVLVKLAGKVIGVNTWEIDAYDLRQALRKVKTGRMIKSGNGTESKPYSIRFKDIPLFTLVDQGQAVVSAYHVKQLFNTFDKGERVTISIAECGGLDFATSTLSTSMTTHINHYRTLDADSTFSGSEVALMLPSSKQPETTQVQTQTQEVKAMSKPIVTPNDDVIVARELMRIVDNGIAPVTFSPVANGIPTVADLRTAFPTITVEGDVVKASDGDKEIAFLKPDKWTPILDADGLQLNSWAALEGDGVPLVFHDATAFDALHSFLAEYDPQPEEEEAEVEDEALGEIIGDHVYNGDEPVDATEEWAKALGDTIEGNEDENDDDYQEELAELEERIAKLENVLAQGIF